MSENIEEYLEALLIFDENKKPLVRIKEWCRCSRSLRRKVM